MTTRPKTRGRAPSGEAGSAAGTACAGTVGLIGLGIMGSSIGANLQAAGFDVVGTDVDDAARRRMRRRIGRVLTDAAGVHAQASRLVTSLPSAAALADVCDALVAAQQARPRRGLVLAETSTLPIADKQRAHDRLAAAGIAMLDAPLSGTGAQAKTRDIVVYASGDAGAVRRMRPVFAGFARRCEAVGGFGAGMRMKLVANLLVAIHNVAAAEAVLFGVRLGLAADTVVAVVGDGAGASRMLQVRGPAMAARRWQPATMKVAVWQKDMQIIRDALEALQLPAPLFAACAPVYQAALAQGHALDDTASVYAVLERMAGGPS